MNDTRRENMEPGVFWGEALGGGNSWTPAHPDTDVLLGSMTGEAMLLFHTLALGRGMKRSRVRSIYRRWRSLRNPDRLTGQARYERTNARDPHYVPDFGRGNKASSTTTTRRER